MFWLYLRNKDASSNDRSRCWEVIFWGVGGRVLSGSSVHTVGTTSEMEARYIQGPTKKKFIHTLTKENSMLYNLLLQIYNIFPSTQQYDICIYFNITYIVTVATCFD